MEIPVLIALLVLSSLFPQQQNARVGSVDFFGTAGVDVRAVRALLPVHPGDELTEDQSQEVRDRLNKAVEKATGSNPTDLALLCCDEHGQLLIYIGLPGSNAATVSVLPPPVGSACLPAQAMHLYDNAGAALAKAIEQGHSSEDDSRGYSLSTDPTARAKQLAMHEYAIAHQQVISRSLQDCAQPAQREAAAALLGYATQSKSQIASLVRASRDADEGVRNNATRALWVLAASSQVAAAKIPASHFVQMLNSRQWTDRNKAGMLLTALTRFPNQDLLRRLRSDALASLIEMARWQDQSHAYAYRLLLGRIAGFNEDRVQQLIAAGKVEEIISAAEGDTPSAHLQLE